MAFIAKGEACPTLPRRLVRHPVRRSLGGGGSAFRNSHSKFKKSADIRRNPTIELFKKQENHTLAGKTITTPPPADKLARHHGRPLLVIFDRLPKAATAAGAIPSFRTHSQKIKKQNEPIQKTEFRSMMTMEKSGNAKMEKRKTNPLKPLRKRQRPTKHPLKSGQFFCFWVLALFFEEIQAAQFRAPRSVFRT